MNKLIRNQNRNKVIKRRLTVFGRNKELHPKNDIISVENIFHEVTFPITKFKVDVQSTGDYHGNSGRQPSNRKRFSQKPRGHIHNGSHLPARMVRERTKLRAEWDESGMTPMTNSEQRELGRYVKRPKKEVMSRNAI
jgi:hypothetical protein